MREVGAAWEANSDLEMRRTIFGTCCLRQGPDQTHGARSIHLRARVHRLSRHNCCRHHVGTRKTCLTRPRSDCEGFVAPEPRKCRLRRPPSAVESSVEPRSPFPSSWRQSSVASASLRSLLALQTDMGSSGEGQFTKLSHAWTSFAYSSLNARCDKVCLNVTTRTTRTTSRRRAKRSVSEIRFGHVLRFGRSA